MPTSLSETKTNKLNIYLIKDNYSTEDSITNISTVTIDSILKIITGQEEKPRKLLEVFKEHSWNPGTQDGKSIEVFFTLPITFKAE